MNHVDKDLTVELDARRAVVVLTIVQKGRQWQCTVGLARRTQEHNNSLAVFTPQLLQKKHMRRPNRTAQYFVITKCFLQRAKAATKRRSLAEGEEI